jgi:hypothetical protein
LTFSENKLETTLTKEELRKIESLVAEKCLDLDREFLKISYRGKDRVTAQIEKILERMEELKKYFKDIDVSIMPKKEKKRVLEILKKIEVMPPWKREAGVKELEESLGKLKIHGYQRSLDEPKLLAVIKYGTV